MSNHGGQTPPGKPIKPDIRGVKAGSSRCASRCRCCCCSGGGRSCLRLLSVPPRSLALACTGHKPKPSKIKQNKNKIKQKTQKEGKTGREGSGQGLGDILVRAVDGKDGGSKEGRK